MKFEEYYEKYTEAGFKALKCRGYNPECKVTNDNLRNNAKIPYTHGFQKESFRGTSLEECNIWMKKKGWIGWVVPKNYIVLDVDKDPNHIAQIDSLIEQRGIDVPVHNTTNGKHYIFAVEKEYSANTAALLRLGFNVTYRIGGKSQLILAPMEPERNWENIEALKNPAEIDEFLTPLNLKDRVQLIEAINIQLEYYYSKSILSGVDLDFSYTGFLVDEVGVTQEEFIKLFSYLFGADFDEDQTELMYVRAKEKEVKQSTGTLIKVLQEKNLQHIIFLIGNLSKLCKKGKPQSPSIDEGERNEIVQYFNKKHSVVDLGGKMFVMREGYSYELESNQRTFYEFMNFKRKYQSMPAVQVGKKMMSQCDVWLNAENRREYDSIDYVPGMETEHLKIFNIWSGFSVEPKEGDCSKYLEHIKNIISSNDNIIYEYILDWMADSVQNLRERPGVAIIMKGKQGVGKGVFASNFGSLFSEHFLHIGRANALVGNFNSEIMGKSMVFADEAFWGGDKQISGILKSMISENTVRIEFKGKEPFYVKNYIRIIAASNNDKVVPAEMSERRFFVIDVSDEKMQKHKYFKDINKEMANGGKEALLKFLLERDISKKDIRNFPKTKALAAQKVYNLSSVDNFFYEILENESIEDFVEGLTCMNMQDRDYFKNTYSSSESWPSSLHNQLFFKIYRWWAKETNDRFPCTGIKSFSRKVRENLGGIISKVKVGNEWTRGYDLLPIEQSKEHFESHIGQKIFDKYEETSDELDLDG
jgi:hypothetical protein